MQNPMKEQLLNHFHYVTLINYCVVRNFREGLNSTKIRKFLTLSPTHSQTIITSRRSTTEMFIHEYFKSNGNSLGFSRCQTISQVDKELTKLKETKKRVRIRASATMKIKNYKF